MNNKFVWNNQFMILIHLQKLQEQLTKRSPTLDRDAVYVRAVRITNNLKISPFGHLTFFIFYLYVQRSRKLAVCQHT